VSSNGISFSVNFRRGGLTFPSIATVAPSDILLLQTFGSTATMYTATVNDVITSNVQIPEIEYTDTSSIIGKKLILDSNLQIDSDLAISEILSGAVTSINGRTGAIQGVSAAVGGTGISVSGATGSVTITNTGVQSFNGSTGAIVGVSRINGLTGAVGITNGSGIGLSVSGNTLTVSNTGVLSIDGSTGAITNVARTNAANTFNQTQSIQGSGPFSSSYLAEYGGSGITINFDTGIDVASQRWSAGLDGGSNTTITFPTDTGTVALTKNVVSSFNGLTGAVSGVTTGTANTFVALQSFTTGISASGGVTFTGNVTISGFTQGVEFKADSALITFGDINLEGNGSKLTIDDSANIVQIENANLFVGGGATFSNKVEFNNNIDMKWTGHGGSTQVVTASGSAGLRISHATGKQIKIGSGGVTDRNTYISVTEDTAGDNDTGKIEFGWTRTDNPEGDPVVYVDGNFVFPQSSGVTGDVLRVKSHDGNNSILEWSPVTGVTTGTANNFIALQTFSAGISASGGVTLAGTLQGTTANFTGLVSSTVGFSGSGTNLTNIVKTINGLSGGVTLAAGTNITLVPSGNTITIDSSGGGGVNEAFVIAMATVL
jgi:hypothetical protein